MRLTCYGIEERAKGQQVPGPSMMSYLTFGAADLGCLSQLFFQNTSALLGVLIAIFNMTAFGVPIDVITTVVYEKIVPGVGVTLFFGNTYYTYLAMRRSKAEGRPFTAQPYGTSAPVSFAFVFNIIYPVYFAGTGTPSENFLKAYNVALAANFTNGVISVVLGAFGPQMLRIVPPAALLVPVAGIGFTFLGLEQASTPFGAPLVGFMTITTFFLGWYGGIRVGWGNFKIPEALQVIIVGVVLGWITGLNKSVDVEDAADLVKWQGPAWTGNEVFENLGDTKDYLGIIFPIAIAAVGLSLMALVSAEAAGDPYPVTESMVADGIGTIIASLFGSPFATVMYFGHPAYKKSGAKTGFSLINGIVYLFLSWFGLIALIRSVVNQQTIGPIVLVVGLTLSEECLRLLPARHYSAVLFGLFPSIADWATIIADRVPLSSFAEDGTAYNSNLPSLTEGWWGILGFKSGAILVSLCWVAILVHIIDRKWWQASVWALIAALFSAVGVIHVPVAGFEMFHETVSNLCTGVTDAGGIVTTATCWEHADQWQYMTAYIMMAVVFIAIEGLRRAGLGDLKEPIESEEADTVEERCDIDAKEIATGRIAIAPA